MATMTAFTAHATRDGGGFWLIHVPEVHRYTQARTFDEIEIMSRDLVAVMTGKDAADLDMTVTVELPESVRHKLDRVEQARSAELKARTEAAAELRSAALELKQTGMSVRELGRVLNVSYQRASQLTSPGR